VFAARLTRSLGHGLLFKLLYYLWLAELGNPASSRICSSLACYGLTLIEFVWRRCLLVFGLLVLCLPAGVSFGLWSACPFMARFVLA